MKGPLDGGIVVPIITPLDEAERIDEPALRRAVDHLLAGGVHAIFAMGTTGESVALTDGEWRRGIEIVLDQAHGRAPVLAGIAAPGTRAAIERLHAVERLGVAAAVSHLPFYYRLDRDEIIGHYRELVAAAAIPIYAYDMPLTKMSFTEEIVAELSRMEMLAGLKDSSNDFTLFQKLVARFEDASFRVFQGNETMLAHSLFAGASGGVLGLGNVAPRLCVALYQACRSGAYQQAYALQRKLVSLHYISRVAPNPLTGVKCATSLLGLGSDRMTSPMRPLNESQKGFVRTRLQELGLLE